jgi:type IV pilus assembly protein PilC
MPQLNYRGVPSTTATVVAPPRPTAGGEVMAGASRRQPTLQPRSAEKGGAQASKKSSAKIKHKDLAVFTRQLGVMINAGLPLVQSLEILASNQTKQSFARVLTGVRSTVEGGSTLSNAFQQYPRAFDQLYCNMIAAGESGGILDGVLDRLSGYIEKAVKLKRAVRSALIYPVSVVTIAVGIMVLLLWKVVPIFATLFVGLGVALPLPTRLVIALSDLVAKTAWMLIVGVVAVVYGLKRYHRIPKGRLVIDGFILKLPVLGLLMRKIAVARFSRTLGTLITSGVPMLEAMDITARTAGNAVIEQAILKVRKAVGEGRTIVDPLREIGVFPNMVVQMIGVGEQTGALDSMLQKVADFYEQEVDAAVADLLTAMEPMIILLLGVMIGGVVISMYLPLFSLIGKLAG